MGAKAGIMSTVGVPAITAANPGTAQIPVLVHPAVVARRVVVRNVSFGAPIWLAFAAAALQEGTLADIFIVPAGKREEIDLQPGEKLYAASPGSDAMVSIVVGVARKLQHEPGE